MQLSSKKLLLKKITHNDLEKFLLLVTNNNVMHFITGDPLSKEKGILKFESILKENIAENKLGHFLVFPKSKKEFIGYAKLVETNRESVELGYMFLPEFWGKGFGHEVSEILTKYAGTIPAIKKVIAIIDPENTASKKILLNSGFRLHETCTVNGLPSAIYHLTL